jgi:hypothetical protein
MSLSEVFSNFGICEEQPQQLKDSEAGLGELAGEIILEGADGVEDIIAAGGLESFHGDGAGEGGGGGHDAGFVVNIEHGAEEADEELD